MRAFPVSLWFFVATAVVFALQLIPIVGIFLMFMLAMLWSVLLINAGMIGIACEAVVGRVSRWWLVLPIGFYAGYFAFAAADHMALRQIGASYDAANASVAIPFNSERQALVFEDGGNDPGGFVQNYRLPVAYSRNLNHSEGFRSSRIIAGEICAMVRENPALRAANINTIGFHDGDAIAARQMESRFCDLTMPERPTLPLLRVARREDKLRYRSLPVTRITTTVTTPDGRRFSLLGGTSAPLGWMPMPVMGCGLNSGAPKWECDAGFWRNDFTPIVAGETRYSRDAATLARALGLRRVEIADRKGGDPSLVRTKMTAVEEAALTQQLAAVDRMIADPLAPVENWQTEVIANRPVALDAKADAIMNGLEEAAAVGGSERSKARESGRILAQLVAVLPADRFATYGPRLLALYRANFESQADGNRRRQSHWLWESEPLLRRLGDLGTRALFIAVDPRASSPTVNGAGIESMCRIGALGRDASGPVLLDRWRKLDRYDRDERRALFVALRRIGIVSLPPTSGSSFQAKQNPMDELIKDWGDITPGSRPRVCSPREWQARREERFGGKRRTNLI